MRIRVISICMGAIALANVAGAQMPVVFQPDTPANAADVNLNFESLDTRVASVQTQVDQSLGTLTIDAASASSTFGDLGVALALCPVNSIPVSANCECTNHNGTANFGVLIACQIATDGGVVGCAHEAITANFLIPPPEAIVHAMCVSAVRQDGSQVLVKGTAGQSKPSEPRDDAQTIFNSIQNRVLDHATALAQ